MQTCFRRWNTRAGRKFCDNISGLDKHKYPTVCEEADSRAASSLGPDGSTETVTLASGMGSWSSGRDSRAWLTPLER